MERASKIIISLAFTIARFGRHFKENVFIPGLQISVGHMIKDVSYFSGTQFHCVRYFMKLCFGNLNGIIL